MTDVIRGLGDLLRLATELAEKAADGQARATYGISVRVGPSTSSRTSTSDAHAARCDVFDEEDHFRVIADVPGVDKDAVAWRVENDRILHISAPSRVRSYHTTIDLEAPVYATAVDVRCENGILELKLWKQRP